MRNFTFELGDEKLYTKESFASIRRREEVLDVIGSERIYQIDKWGFKDERLGVFEARNHPSQFLYYAEDYMAEAKQLLAKNAYTDVRKDVCLIAMKIAALMTALMEQHGVEQR